MHCVQYIAVQVIEVQRSVVQSNLSCFLFPISTIRTPHLVINPSSPLTALPTALPALRTLLRALDTVPHPRHTGSAVLQATEHSDTAVIVMLLLQLCPQEFISPSIRCSLSSDLKL